MKQLFTSILNGVLLFAAFYLIGAFVNSNFNISTWSLEARALVGVAGGLLSIVLIIVSYDIQKNY